MEEELLTDKEVMLQIEQWKDQYQAIYIAEINEEWYIFRGLTRSEFKKATEYYEDEYDRAEYVCRLCVLDPVDIDYSDEQYAGIPETLCRLILEESGFASGSTKVKDLMLKYQKEMESFEHQITCVIAEAFPQFSPEEIENWSIEKTMWYFSRAKWTLQTLRGIELTQEQG